MIENKTEYIKSPLNYPGSKTYLIDAILDEIPSQIDTFVDVMGGAFNVGINVSQAQKIVYNEVNPFVYELICFLLKEKEYDVIREIEAIIEEFQLQKGNKENYISLREYYNANKTPVLLFVLHLYSFQCMIRFNKKGKFNVPIGDTGYSKFMKRRIEKFKTKKQITLLNKDYTAIDYLLYPLDTLFYFDPPYYTTHTVYNESWTLKNEEELLETLVFLDRNGYRFMLSNVIYHKDKTHHLLIDWVQKNKFKLVNLGVTGSRYKKEEVLIKNY